MHDVLGNGVKFRSFNVIDDYNREGLNITLDTSLNAKRVVKELDQLIAWRGTPRRPHESLGYKSPVDFAQERLRSKAPQTLLCDSNFNWKSLVLNASN